MLEKALVRDRRISSAGPWVTGVPVPGPFLVSLLERLDLATTNSLQLNLLLMSVISRLCHQPQPLVSSLLLNPTLVLQPSVRSLVQVRPARQNKAADHTSGGRRLKLFGLMATLGGQVSGTSSTCQKGKTF